VRRRGAGNVWVAIAWSV